MRRTLFMHSTWVPSEAWWVITIVNPNWSSLWMMLRTRITDHKQTWYSTSRLCKGIWQSPSLPPSPQTQVLWHPWQSPHLVWQLPARQSSASCPRWGIIRHSSCVICGSSGHSAWPSYYSWPTSTTCQIAHLKIPKQGCSLMTVSYTESSIMLTMPHNFSKTSMRCRTRNKNG